MAGGDEGGRLVLGATSLIGRFLLRRLAEIDHPPVALSRHPRPAEPGVRWVQGDLGRPETLQGLDQEGQVFCLAPIWTLAAALPILHGLGLRRLVCFSSTSRFTKAASGSGDERAVAEALAKGEAEVETFCRTYGVEFTILRPTLIYAEGWDGNVSRLAGLIRRFGLLPLPSGPGGLRQPVHADDLASAALAAMTSPAAVNQAYDLPGGETLAYRSMVERIFEGLGRPCRIVSLPSAVLRLGYVLGRPWLPGSTAEMIGRIDADLTFDGEPARRDLGWAPRDFHPRF